MTKQNTMSILTLFESVTIDTETMLAEADLSFCHRIEREFKLLIAQLNWAKDSITSMEKQYSEPNYTIESFSDYHFDPHKTLEKIEELEEGARVSYLDHVRRYFNSAYNLNFSKEDVEKCNDWQAIANKVISMSGGSLREAGINNILTAFRKHMWKQNGVQVRGATVSIGRYSYILESFGRIRIDRWRDAYKDLVKALSYFETGSTSPLGFIEKSFEVENLDPHCKNVVSELCNKWKGFRIYQNCRIDLHFDSKETANAFYQTFKLNCIEA